MQRRLETYLFLLSLQFILGYLVSSDLFASSLQVLAPGLEVLPITYNFFWFPVTEIVISGCED